MGFSVGMKTFAEPVLNIKRSGSDYELMLFDKVIAYDHFKQKICIVVNMKTDHVMENYGKAMSEIERIVRIIYDKQPLNRLHTETKPDFACNVSKEEYCAMVEKTKKYIFDGDIFQAVISRRFESAYHNSLINALPRTAYDKPIALYGLYALPRSGDHEHFSGDAGAAAKGSACHVSRRRITAKGPDGSGG